VAAVQGALGGLSFWFLGISAPVLWAVVMALCSLLPAVGAAIVWFPVAVYFSRRSLVGGGAPGLWRLCDGLGGQPCCARVSSAKTPRCRDYLVLLSTLGGIAAFGLSGFVIGPVVAALFIAV
jgi:predicted PurR-regulated permease PerM